MNPLAQAKTLQLGYIIYFFESLIQTLLVNEMKLNVCRPSHLNSTEVFSHKHCQDFLCCWQAQSNQEIGFLSWLDKGE